jgi:FHA domain
MTQRILIRHRGGKRANQLDQFLADTFNEILVGRDESAAVRFDPEQDDLVSRLHLRIVRDASCPSGYQVVDLQSRNGTYLNGHRLFAPTPISHNDILQLGPGGPEVSFELDPPPPVAAKPTREVSDFRLDRDSSPRPRPTRIADIEPGVPSFSGTPEDSPRPIGRATVERMLDDNFSKVKHESNKSVWVGVAAAVLVIAASAIGLRLMRKNAADTAISARQQQALLQQVDQAVKQSPQPDAVLREQVAQLNSQLKKLEEHDAKTSAVLSEMLANERKAEEEADTPQPQQPVQNAASIQKDSAADAYDQQVKKALELLKTNQAQPAMQAAAQLISQYPNRWESYGVAGTVLRSQSKLPEAKLAYQRAMELAPNDIRPQLASVIQQIDSQTAANKPVSR